MDPAVESPIRTGPSGRVAATLIVCLFALAGSALVWPPPQDPWRPRAWIDGVRAEQRRVLERGSGPDSTARALAAIRAHRFAELLRHVSAERAREIATQVPLLGVDPATGRVVPVDRDGRPYAGRETIAARDG